MDNTVLTSIMDGAVGPDLEKAPTGIPGLDQITGGGLPLGRVTLVAGSAGAGKTLLGLNFLVSGAREHGERDHQGRCRPIVQTGSTGRARHRPRRSKTCA